MNKVTPTLQSLIMGDRSVFITNFEGDTKSVQLMSKIAPILAQLDNQGYSLTNPAILFHTTDQELEDFKAEFEELVSNSTKKGVVIRKSFFDEGELTEHTDEEWGAITAQYALTYGWADEFVELTGTRAQDVFDNYISTFINDSIDLTFNSNTTKVKLGTKSTDLLNVVTSLLSSKVVLRTQQLEVLKNTPVEVLKKAARTSNIIIKDTLVLVMNLLSDTQLNFALLKSAQDVLKYVIYAFAENPVEGQVVKGDLKNTKIHIPTKQRKAILNNLERLGQAKGAKFLTEDMFSFESYWKIIHRYLQFEKYENTRMKYPFYTAAIDLLYENDRSWTFNGRFSAAKEALDYDAAIRVAAERPGFMLRNVMEFLRMATGVPMPMKDTSNQYARAHNPFQQIKARGNKTVKTDALSFFKSDTFQSICNNRLNTKLAFQLIEQIMDPANNVSLDERNIQGNIVRYLVPVPAINKEMKTVVLKQLHTSIKTKLHASNSDIKKIYVDKDVMKQALQYSGQKSTEISYSGNFLSPNSVIPIDDIVEPGTILRLGVMWRSIGKGYKSVDIDHNVTLFHKSGRSFDVYYGSPTFKNTGGKVIASSSGDITTCGNEDDKFSTEVVDLNLEDLKAAGIVDLYNSFVDYGGEVNIGDIECYTFIQIIGPNNKTFRPGVTELEINLNHTDYAIRIDPNNTDKTGAYIGVHFNLKQDTLEVLAIPVKTPNGQYSNIKTTGAAFKKQIASRPQSLTLGYAMGLAFPIDSVVQDMEEADVIISRKPDTSLTLAKSQTLLRPETDMEKINEFIFA